MHTLLVAVLVFAVVCLQCAEYESVKVSPKLDFVESKEENSSKGKSPKIQGVRVIVDTTKGKKSTESKSVDDDDDDDATGTKTKTVGIRTDITLEITEEDDDDSVSNKTAKSGGGKKTKDVVDEDDDDPTANKDRRVPVIKGSGTGGGAPKPGPPSSEEGWNIHNVPVVYGKDVQSRRADAIPGVSTADRWNSQPAPFPIWTTERPPPRPLYYLTDYQSNRGPSFKPVAAQNPWKPCRCQQQPPSYPQWKTYRPDRRTFVRPIQSRPPSGSSSRGVDDKLEYPFTSSSDSDY